MSARRALLPGIAALALLAGSGRLLGASQPASDLNTPDRRRPTVEMAARLASLQTVPPFPASLAQPFSPSGFDQPDPDERAAALAAQRTSQATASSQLAAGHPPKEAKLSDRELLAELSSKVMPSGMIQIGKIPMLLFKRSVVRIGAVFTVQYQGSAYDLKLTGIERTTFTLRLNREELTRPIQPGKTP